jgi:hypothetical protein
MLLLNGALFCQSGRCTTVPPRSLKNLLSVLMSLAGTGLWYLTSA